MRIFATLTSLSLALIISISAFAQDEEDHSMKFITDGDIPITGFIGPMIELSDISGDLAMSVGGGGGILFYRNFYMGGYGMRLANDLNYRPNADSTLSLNYGTGGLWFGYLNRTHDIVHLGLSTKIGWGNMAFDNQLGQEIVSEDLFMVTPQIELEVNIAPWAKVNFGVGVRMASGLGDNSIYDDDDFNSPVGSISLQLGWFDD